MTNFLLTILSFFLISAVVVSCTVGFIFRRELRLAMADLRTGSNSRQNEIQSVIENSGEERSVRVSELIAELNNITNGISSYREGNAVYMVDALEIISSAADLQLNNIEPGRFSLHSFVGEKYAVGKNLIRNRRSQSFIEECEPA